jgi:hypothetical protein
MPASFPAAPMANIKGSFLDAINRFLRDNNETPSLIWALVGGLAWIGK